MTSLIERGLAARYIEYLLAIQTTRQMELDLQRSERETLREILGHGVNREGSLARAPARPGRGAARVRSEPGTRITERWRQSQASLAPRTTGGRAVASLGATGALGGGMSDQNMWQILAGLTPESLIPVTVRPSNTQIESATEALQYCQVANPPNNSCPIRQEEFTANDEVLQIIPCGHLFFPGELRRWFRSSVRCPLCRTDIRDYDPRQAMRNPYSRGTSNTAPRAAETTALSTPPLNSTSATAELDAATQPMADAPPAPDNRTGLNWSDEIANILTGGMFGPNGTGVPPGTSVTVEYAVGGGSASTEATTQTPDVPAPPPAPATPPPPTTPPPGERALTAEGGPSRSQQDGT